MARRTPLPVPACAVLLLLALVPGRSAAAAAPATTAMAATPSTPGATWETGNPAAVGLDPARLTEFTHFVGGRGVIVRHGRMVQAWGNASARGDVASAVKPLFTHFLLRALRESRIPSLDEPVVHWEPRLAGLNADLGFKDAAITWRHLATQTSLYGLREAPGTAFAYNDWQIALFADLLFTRVHATPWPEVDARLLLPFLRDTLGCEDDPTLLAHAGGRQPGRLHISPRDFARLGLLYLREGRWNDRQLIPAADIRLALDSPLPATLPRAGTEAAALLPGQRTLGSQRIPDNQTDHFGSYSFLWWVNGLETTGRRHWPDAPPRTFAALGHGGRRALAVLPGPDLVVSWNDSRIESPAAENEAFRLLMAAVLPSGTPGPQPVAPPVPSRLRVVIETDAGGDPDDEQSLVRFLLHASAWDVEGIIANRPRARDGENRNPARTGLGIVHRLLDAYSACWNQLVLHDPGYPAPDALRRRAVAGYDDTDDAVRLLMETVDRSDPRPVWYSDWGTDQGSATNNLRRALDRVLRERGPEGYARFKSRIRLNSCDAFGDHSTRLDPPFPLRVDTWRPELNRQRWYHRFSALTSGAGGFDLVRDALTGHGPLGALYPTNTTHWAKEGDSLSFLYLMPNGLNAPEHPDWGGWGGRLAPVPPASKTDRGPLFDARVADVWKGATHRDLTLRRWADDLQNEFRARLDWCVSTPAAANHPPDARLRILPPAPGEDPARPTPILESPDDFAGGHLLRLTAGETVMLSADGSTDPDANPLRFEWIHYPEPGTWRGEVQSVVEGPSLTLTAPEVAGPETLHWIVRVTDTGLPPLSRYRRVVGVVRPRETPPRLPALLVPLAPYFEAPPGWAAEPGRLRPLTRFIDGRPVGVSDLDWAERRREILDRWHALMGPWPSVADRPELAVLARERRENFEQRRVRVGIAPGQTAEGWLLVPDGPGPFPAVFVPYYEPETSIGRGAPLRDFALQLTRRGFVTLALGSPGGDARKPDTGFATCQPLSFLACVAAHAARVLTHLPGVDGRRLGIVGHSYGGKWALFGAALCDEYACAAFSDPGIVWDEARPNVNYWDPWYLGREFDRSGKPAPGRPPGLPGKDHPRTGAYAALVRDGHDLHELLALIAPRPFLVSGGSEDPPDRWHALAPVVGLNRDLGYRDRVALTRRAGHDPTPESNGQIYDFLEAHLGNGAADSR